MSTNARDAIEIQSREAAARLLSRAAQFFDLHARRPLFQKTMRYGPRQSVVVRMEDPGILEVLDPSTGERLAESVCGQLEQLAPTFRLPGTR